MRKTLNSYFIVIVLMLGFMAHIGLSALESRTKGKYSSKIVLIISVKKDLQDPVIAKVKAALKKEGCYVLLSGIKELNNSMAEKFSAIVIINKTNQKDKKIKVFLDEQQQKKIVLLNAEGNEYWKSGKIDNSDKIAKDIIENIHIVFNAGK